MGDPFGESAESEAVRLSKVWGDKFFFGGGGAPPPPPKIYFF